MKESGYIRSFGAYTAQMLEQTKKDLRIQMPVEALAFCAAYYRTELRRDPTIEELHLLDGLFASTMENALVYAPTELFTNDAFVAQTYADLMEKRRACTANLNAPATLEELAQLLPRYLERTGKQKKPEGVHLQVEDTASVDHCTSKQALLFAKDSRFCMRVSPQCKATESAGDWFVLLRPTQGQTDAEFRFAVGTLLSAQPLAEQIQACHALHEGGLLAALLKMTGGAKLETEHLAKTQEPLPLQFLIDGYAGDYLLRISKSSAPLLRKTADELKLSVAVFGVATNDAFLEIKRSEERLIWKASFLRSLVDLHPVKAYLANEGASTGEIRLFSGDVQQNPYFSDRPEPLSDAVSQEGDILFSTASAAPESSFFLHGLYTAIAPICALAASGVSYEDLTLNYGLSLPKACLNEEHFGECISSLLGIYRAQAEFATPSSSVLLLNEDAKAHPEIAVFAAGKGTLLPSFFTTSGSRVYLLRPIMQENGMPNFDSLRQLLRTLLSWNRGGILRAARLVCGELLTDAVLGMRQGGRYCLVENGDILFSPACSFGILVESDAELSATFIGKVAAKEEALTKTEYLLPLDPARFIWKSEPELVILAAKRDGYASAMAKRLSDEGARVTLFSSPYTNEEAIARAMLSARAVLLCGNAALPQNPQTLFALDTMRRAGGACIALGKDKKEADLYLPDGLSAQNLALLCQKSEF